MFSSSFLSSYRVSPVIAMTTPMTTASTLPCIDISPFLLETSELTEKQKLCARALDDACVKFGFFLLSGCDSVISEDEFSHMLVSLSHSP